MGFSPCARVRDSAVALAVGVGMGVGVFVGVGAGMRVGVGVAHKEKESRVSGATATSAHIFAPRIAPHRTASHRTAAQRSASTHTASCSAVELLVHVDDEAIPIAPRDVYLLTYVCACSLLACLPARNLWPSLIFIIFVAVFYRPRMTTRHAQTKWLIRQRVERGSKRKSQHVSM